MAFGGARPLNVTNCDNRLIASAVRIALEHKIAPTITQAQRGFLRGRSMLANVVDGNMESIAFEDTLREMFGIHGFKAFTLDKVIANCVRQLQHLVTDESSVECWDLYQSEKKNNGTGGEVSTADKRCFAELLYQKKREKIWSYLISILDLSINFHQIFCCIQKTFFYKNNLKFTSFFYYGVRGA